MSMIDPQHGEQDNAVLFTQGYAEVIEMFADADTCCTHTGTETALL